jgi:acetyltransferase-like isoleucine patch superfamily enzyme
MVFGGGRTYPELNFTLPPIELVKANYPQVKRHYQQIIAGALKRAEDWVLSKTLIQQGASLGANSTIVCGITVGRWAMVGAGSVVTHDVPDYGLVRGNPARLVGFVCPCGQTLTAGSPPKYICPACGTQLEIMHEAK